MTFYIAQIRQDFLNYTRRHNENPVINPRDVESSGGSCVRGLGVLVPAKASL